MTNKKIPHMISGHRNTVADQGLLKRRVISTTTCALSSRDDDNRNHDDYARRCRLHRHTSSGVRIQRACGHLDNRDGARARRAHRARHETRTNHGVRDTQQRPQWSGAVHAQRQCCWRQGGLALPVQPLCQRPSTDVEHVASRRHCARADDGRTSVATRTRRPCRGRAHTPSRPHSAGRRHCRSVLHCPFFFPFVFFFPSWVFLLEVFSRARFPLCLLFCVLFY